MTTMDDWKLVAAVVPWGKNTRGKQPSDILQQDDEENIDDETWHQSVVTMNPCWMPVLHKQLIFIFQMASVIVRKNTIWLAKQNTPQTNSSLTNSHESISGNPSSTHNTLCWGTCSSGSCKDMLGGRRMNQTAQMGHEKTVLVVSMQSGCGCDTVMTLTQGGVDTTTWSVCTCWPEAVTTGASVCSCTAVTVPCVCRQGRTIHSQTGYYQESEIWIWNLLL